MFIKNLSIQAFLLSSLSAMTFNAFAIERGTANLPSFASNVEKSASEVAKDFIVSESFVQGGVTYTVYKGLKAEFNKGTKNDAPDINKTDKVFSNKQFTVYSVKPSGKESLNEKNSLKSSGQQVVLNSGSKNFGILSGVIIVKTKDNSSFVDSTFEIVKSYPNLGYYIVRIPENLTIQKSIDKIKRNQVVTDVTVEVLESFKEAL